MQSHKNRLNRSQIVRLQQYVINTEFPKQKKKKKKKSIFNLLKFNYSSWLAPAHRNSNVLTPNLKKVHLLFSSYKKLILFLCELIARSL